MPGVDVIQQPMLEGTEDFLWLEKPLQKNEATYELALGANVAEFERRGAALLAKQHGVLVNSGSSALRLAIDLLGCEPGDEIITPALTFSTDIAPMVQSGIVPAFVDVDPETYQIDATRIEEMIGPRTKAISMRCFA